MYHTTQKMLPAAQSCDNEEMAQTYKKLGYSGARAPPSSPLHSHSAKPRNSTITTRMRQNATKCYRFSEKFEWTGSRASPFDHPSITRQSHPNCGRVTRNAPTKPQYLSWLRKSPSCCHYPSFPRRRESIPRLQSCNDIETNAILIPGCERGNSQERFRMQRSEVRNLKSSPSKTPRVAGSALP